MHNYQTLPQKIFDTVLGIQPDVLNVAPNSVLHPTTEALDIQLKQHTGRIKAEAIDVSTGRIDYTHLRDSLVYRDYRQLTAQLAHFELNTLIRREQKLAFWLNLYNAMTIDGIIHYGIRKRITEMPGFFRQTAYSIGAYRFCLDDIENGILRANAGHPFIPGPQFGEDDPRCAFALDHVDFRIHFALVCGAESCPPINFYDAEHIETQLDLATRNFLEQNLEVDTQANSIKLSKILQWYSTDFGASAWVKVGFGDKTPLLQTIQPYIVDQKKRTLIDTMVNLATIRFKSYNWALNSL